MASGSDNEQQNEIKQKNKFDEKVIDKDDQIKL